MTSEPTAEEFFAGHPFAFAVYTRVLDMVRGLGPTDVRVSKSQVALRRRRGFAYLWMPGQYLSHTDVDVVLSIALGRHDHSARWKEVAHPSARHWIHHLEVRAISDLDDEVTDWLREAAERAG